MGIDLGAPFVMHHEATTASWPLCYKCSKALQRPFPVESMALVGRERPTQLGEKFKVVVEVECHGDKMTFELSHPAWWGEANLHDALGQCAAFHKNGQGLYDMVKVQGMRRRGPTALDWDRDKYRG